MNRTEKITEAITKSINEVFRHPSFYEWATKESKHTPKTGDIILVNNSFVFRDVKTKKSDLCLAVEIGQNLKPTGKIFIANTDINSDFKYYTPVVEKGNLHPLGDKLTQQLHTLGELVFILIGRVRDQTAIETRLSHPVFKKFIWNPRIKRELHVRGQTITIRNVQEWETIWQTMNTKFLEMIQEDPQKYFENHYRKQKSKKEQKKEPEKTPTEKAQELQQKIEAEIDELKKVLEDGIADLQDLALADLVIPTGNEKNKGTQPHILCRIVDALSLEREKYFVALQDVNKDPIMAEQAFHEILRIAYNFENEAITLLNLVVSICDLKPVVLWGTIHKHYALSEAFRDLPWFHTKRKPSLKNYKAVIDNMRNNAFHTVFPFHKTLEVAIPRSALKEAKLRFFSEYDNRKENSLNFQDKELVDVLVEFTRARTRPASSEFWEKNLVVMDALIDLFRETGHFLSILR